MLSILALVKICFAKNGLTHKKGKQDQTLMDQVYGLGGLGRPFSWWVQKVFFVSKTGRQRFGPSLDGTSGFSHSTFHRNLIG